MLGYKFYRDKVILRKKTMYNVTRNAKAVKKMSGKLPVYRARRMLSYNGLMRIADTKEMYVGRVRPHTSIKKCKKIVSHHDKKMNRINKGV